MFVRQPTLRTLVGRWLGSSAIGSHGSELVDDEIRAISTDAPLSKDWSSHVHNDRGTEGEHDRAGSHQKGDSDNTVERGFEPPLVGSVMVDNSRSLLGNGDSHDGGLGHDAEPTRARPLATGGRKSDSTR